MKISYISLFLTLVTIGCQSQDDDYSKAIISQAINGEILNQISIDIDNDKIEYRMGQDESFTLYNDTVDFSFLVDTKVFNQINLVVGTSMRRENASNESYCNFGPRDDMHLLFKFLAKTPNETNNKLIETTAFSIPTTCNSHSNKELLLRMWNEYERIKNKVFENKKY